MEDPVEMTKHDAQKTSSHGWKSQVLAFYQSWVIIITECYYIILKILQELFKSDAATSKHGKDKEDAPKKAKAATGVSNLRSAGEIERENTNEVSEITQPHTVVDLPPAATPASEPPKQEVVTPSAITTEPPKQDQGVIPVPEQPSLSKSASSVEPNNDQSKNTLVIKNLPFKFKLNDLEKLLNEHQAKPKNVRLLRDDSGKFTGMAFIRCASKEDAQRLITSMHGLDIGGRNIQVEFKTKKQKKKNKLGQSTDSLNSSSDELPNGNRLRHSSEGIADRLRHSNEGMADRISTVTVAAVPAPPQLQKVVQAPPQIQPQKANFSKLSVSAEHSFEDKQQSKQQQQLPFRRKSLAVEPTSYLHSRVHIAPSNGIRPIRQPVGPDGKTNGFSEDYRRARNLK